MSTIITRLFRTEKQAIDAAKALRGAEFEESEITVILGSDGSANPTAVAGTIAAAGVPRSHAAVYTRLVANGASLVSVVAPLYMGDTASRTLRRFDPMETEISEPDIHVPGTDQLSIWRRGPMAKLLHSDTTSLSIIRNAKPMAKVDIHAKPRAGLLHGTLSSWLGIPTLTSNR